MADDRTEEASPKKKKDARKKGNLAKSKEVVNTLTFTGIVLSGMLFSELLLTELKKFMTKYLSSGYLLMDIEKVGTKSVFFELIISYLSFFLPFGILLMILGVIGHTMQTGFLLISEPLKPKLSKMNPINGFKNIFSLKSLGTLVKNLLILTFLSLVCYNFVSKNISSIINMGDVYLPYLPSAIGSIVGKLFTKILLGLIVIAAIDYTYQAYTHKKQLRMTKQEVKEEYKQQEGDPQVKGRIKQKQKQMAQSRMMQNVKDATVVLVNPTHIAIALRYDKDKDSAPVVVAKGADYVAARIKNIAKENDIPIIENKPLARSLYKQVELDSEIPVDFYQVVSEILIQIYELKRKSSYKEHL